MPDDVLDWFQLGLPSLLLTRQKDNLTTLLDSGHEPAKVSDVHKNDIRGARRAGQSFQSLSGVVLTSGSQFIVRIGEATRFKSYEVNAISGAVASATTSAPVKKGTTCERYVPRWIRPCKSANLVLAEVAVTLDSGLRLPGRSHLVESTWRTQLAPVGE